MRSEARRPFVRRDPVPGSAAKEGLGIAAAAARPLTATRRGASWPTPVTAAASREEERGLHSGFGCSRIEGGELFERVIDDDFVLTEKACAIFVRQICEGVDYMHSKNILHLDMKPENVLCTTRTGNRIKLIDFGLARFYEPGKKLQVLFGTPEFVAPEVVNFDKVGYQTDMWSVGVICYVLLSGLSPFMGNSELETMANVTRAEYDFDDESFDQISEEAKDFIAKLLLKDKEDRMTASQGLNHPWLRKDKKRDDTQLDKKKLKRFVIRRRWQKMVNAFLALRRMGATISPSTP
ncbi:hypothetical protein HPB49_018379 [Dermacentor silvarum]|uniref:Uncharacterized protein n=1 Tax=Dermacentor silvarum TaxID=543639 RepID=A0ACB8CZ98_DERSI|nr:hypothetical protein HPB49_018379 [Dermacentor silvarum]